MLEFDAATRRILDRSYAGSDVVRRRLENFRALDPKPGERVLDLGCGSGFLTAEIARAVGDAGHVLGVDPSPDMRAGAEENCAGFGKVQIAAGDAGAIPAEDGAFDKIVSLQVFEYLDDVPTALAEVSRVLRPGGRLVVGDWHWDCFAWHSADPSRMARMMASWDEHLAERCVPALLPALMSDAGFTFGESRAVPFTDTCLRADGMANMMLHLMAGYARQNGHLPETEIAAWKAEQEELARAGRFFFSLTHFVTVAHKA